MRNVDDNAELVRPADHCLAELAQPLATDTMQRTAEFIVEEVRQPDYAQALLEKAIEILDVAFEWVRTLNQVNGADDRLAAFASGHDFIQAAPVDDDDQVTSVGKTVQLFQLVRGAFVEAEPGSRRPE